MNSPEQIKNQEGAEMEQEQTREQIEAAVKEALEKALVFDMVYDGQEVRDCVCMMGDGAGDDGLYISMIEDDGEIGMGSPADIEKIRKITLIGPFKQNE
jgi:hypothetical protein